MRLKHVNIQSALVYFELDTRQALDVHFGRLLEAVLGELGSRRSRENRRNPGESKQSKRVAAWLGRSVSQSSLGSGWRRDSLVVGREGNEEQKKHGLDAPCSPFCKHRLVTDGASVGRSEPLWTMDEGFEIAERWKLQRQIVVLVRNRLSGNRSEPLALRQCRAVCL